MNEAPHHLAPATAIWALPRGETVHVFTNPSGGVLVGSDLPREDVEAMIREAILVEVGGPACRGMGHGIVAWGSKADSWFISHRDDVDLDTLTDAKVYAERARCKSLVLDIYDGAPDAGTVPMSEIARIAREIEEPSS